jgi:hypothetical protein
VTTVTREALCRAKVCPFPSDPFWHVCIVCGNPEVDHQHVDSRKMGGSKSRDVPENIVMLCRAHHDEVTLNKVRDTIQNTPVGRFYVRIGNSAAETKAYPLPDLGASTAEGEDQVKRSTASVSPSLSAAGASFQGASSDGGKVTDSGQPEVSQAAQSAVSLADTVSALPLSPGASIQEDTGAPDMVPPMYSGEGVSNPPSPPTIAESLKPNGLELPDEFTFTDWTDLAGMVAGMNKNRQWWAGDLMLAGERFGERATQYWNDLGYKYESLANCIRVCRRFPRPLRNESAQFSHHAVVYAVEDNDEATYYLDAAVTLGWTVKQLREAVFGRKPKAVRFTIPELKERLALWPGERSVRNNGRLWAQAFLESLSE